MVKKRKALSKGHEMYLKIGVSLIVLVVFFAFFSIFFTGEQLAGQAITPGNPVDAVGVQADGTCEDGKVLIISPELNGDRSFRIEPKSGCCPADQGFSCVSSSQCFKSGSGWDYSFCFEGSWLTCDGHLNRETAYQKNRGEIAGEYVCLSDRGWDSGNGRYLHGTWTTPNTCTQEGEIYAGKLICKDGKWESCENFPGLICSMSYWGVEYSAWCIESNIGTLFEKINDVHQEADDDGNPVWKGISYMTSGSYYCQQKDADVFEWLKCDDSQKGKIKDKKYICGNGRWNLINCRSCFSTGVGECVASSKVDIASADTSIYHYEDAERQVGCSVQKTDCFLDGGVSYDKKKGNLVCGNENNLLECRTSSQNFPSDGGTWMCSSSGSWNECTSNNNGQVFGAWTCAQVSGEWKWASETSCTPTTKYQIKENDNSEKVMCDGSTWLGCEEAEQFGRDEPHVIVACSGGTVSINEKWTACHNGEDDDNDGDIDCADADCKEDHSVTIGNNENYQVILRKNECTGVEYSIT
jgi:hypothetical protein